MNPSEYPTPAVIATGQLPEVPQAPALLQDLEAPLSIAGAPSNLGERAQMARDIRYGMSLYRKAASLRAGLSAILAGGGLRRAENVVFLPRPYAGIYRVDDGDRRNGCPVWLLDGAILGWFSPDGGLARSSSIVWAGVVPLRPDFSLGEHYPNAYLRSGLYQVDHGEKGTSNDWVIERLETSTYPTGVRAENDGRHSAIGSHSRAYFTVSADGNVVAVRNLKNLKRPMIIGAQGVDLRQRMKDGELPNGWIAPDETIEKKTLGEVFGVYLTGFSGKVGRVIVPSQS